MRGLGLRYGCGALNTLTNPDFLLGESFVEQGILPLFNFENIFFTLQVSRIVAVKFCQLAAIDFNKAGGQIIHKAAIVANK